MGIAIVTLGARRTGEWKLIHPVWIRIVFAQVARIGLIVINDKRSSYASLEDTSVGHYHPQAWTPTLAAAFRWRRLT